MVVVVVVVLVVVMVVVVVLVVVMVVVLVVVIVIVLVLPSSLVIQWEHPQSPREQMLTVAGWVLGCRSLVPPSLMGLVLSFPRPSLGWCRHSLVKHPRCTLRAGARSGVVGLGLVSLSCCCCSQ